MNKGSKKAFISIGVIIVITVVTAIIAGGGTYYVVQNRANKELDKLNDQMNEHQKKLEEVQQKLEEAQNAQAINTEITDEENSTITTDETANWKVYRNKPYDYSMKYPDEWSVVLGQIGEAATSDSEAVSFLDPSAHIESPNIYMSSASSVAKTVEDASSDLSSPVVSNVTLGNVTATKITGVISKDNMGEGESRIRYVINKGKGLIIEISPTDARMEIIDKMLDTFRLAS